MDSSEGQAIIDADESDGRSNAPSLNLAGTQDAEWRRRMSEVLLDGGFARPRNWYRVALAVQRGYAPDD